MTPLSNSFCSHSALTSHDFVSALDVTDLTFFAQTPIMDILFNNTTKHHHCLTWRRHFHFRRLYNEMLTSSGISIRAASVCPGNAVFVPASLATPRLQAIAFPLIHGMEKVQVIPAPKEIDPRLLTWKGCSVLAKLDAVGDMWIQASDWVSVFISMRDV